MMGFFVSFDGHYTVGPTRLEVVILSGGIVQILGKLEVLMGRREIR